MWDQVIETELAQAKCVIVLWSKHSVDSEWVRIEAEEARQRGILVPALLDDVKIPLAFRRIQAAHLVDWSGEGEHPEFLELCRAVRDAVGVADKSPPASTSPEAKARIKEDAAVAPEELWRAEEERRARDKAEDDKRAAEEQIAREKALAARRAEDERLAREKSEAAKRAEQERIAREKTEAVKRADQQQIARETAEAAKRADDERVGRENGAAAKRAEDQRLARESMEAARRAEEERAPREIPFGSPHPVPVVETGFLQRYSRIILAVGVLVVLVGLVRWIALSPKQSPPPLETSNSPASTEKPAGETAAAASTAPAVSPPSGGSQVQANGYEPAKTFAGHTSEATQAAFSQDGRLLASTSRDGFAIVWDIATGRQLQKFSVEDGFAVAFSRDAKLLATGSLHAGLKWWDVTDGANIANLVPAESIYDLALSPDGSLLASAGWEGLSIWDVKTKERTKVPNSASSISVDWSADGRYLATAGGDASKAGYAATVRLFDNQFRQVRNFGSGSEAVALSPDSSLLASGGEDKVVTVREVSSGRTVKVLPGFRGKVRSVAFTPDGGILAVGAWAEVRLYAARDWSVLQTIPQEPAGGNGRLGVNSVAFSSDGQWMAIAGQVPPRVSLFRRK
jgi:hypothetical protein